MPWVTLSFRDEPEYCSPSALHLNKASSFNWRKFGTNIHPVELNGYMSGRDRRYWFSRGKVREFNVYYGYNPRCCHKGTYGKPGFGHWRRNRI